MKIKDSQIKFLFLLLVILFIINLFNFNIGKISGDSKSLEKSNIATISSRVYDISTERRDGIIADVPGNTPKNEFLINLTKDDENQTWNDEGIRDPVRNDDSLVVTSEDELNQITYVVNIIPDAPLSDKATVSSNKYTISNVGDGWETITGVIEGTSKSDFLGALTKDNDNEFWEDTFINDPVLSEDFLIVTSEDEVNQITYTITVEAPSNDPTVLSTSSPASLITQTSVTLNGEIALTGEDESPTAGFEYGTDESYGTTIEVGSFSANQSYSSNILNLTCGTVYHYRSYATNSIETVYGNDTTFTTNVCDSRSITTGSTLESILKFQEEQKAKAQALIDSIIHTTQRSTGSTTSSATRSPTTSKNPQNKTEEKKITPTLEKENSSLTPPTTPIAPTVNSVSVAPTITRTLKLTEKRTAGSDVSDLQTYLNIHGFSTEGNLVVDGVFGNKTKQAVINFQKANNLDPDGVVGPKTSALLK